MKEPKKISEIFVELQSMAKYNLLPINAINHAKILILDVLGSMIGSKELISSKIAVDIALEWGGPEESTIVGAKKKVSVMNAAFANAIQCYGFDFTDDHNESNAHPSPATIPAALAIGEIIGCNGKKLIEAVALGNEVVCRLGSAFMGQMYYQGFHPTSTCGTFGAAMTAAKLLKLNRQEAIYCQGIAGSMVGGLMAWNSEGSFTKRLQAGHPSMCGILAAKMAQKGYNGPSDIYEGKEGFLNAYSYQRKYDLKYITEDLGKEWIFSTSSIKVYPCCRYSGGHLDACLEIVKQYNPDPKKIDKIIIRTSNYTKILLTEPSANKWDPKTVVDAQFSMPYQAAAALVRGKMGTEEFTAESIHDVQIRKLMKKVEVVLDQEFEDRYPDQYSSAVTVKMKDGKEYTAVIDNPKGDKRNPVSKKEVEEKFYSLTKGIFKNDKRISEIISCVDNIEDQKNTAKLMRLVNSALK
jgi:2-methylcitrate dehydratase PrpD